MPLATSDRSHPLWDVKKHGTTFNAYRLPIYQSFNDTSSLKCIYDDLCFVKLTLIPVKQSKTVASFGQDDPVGLLSLVNLTNGMLTSFKVCTVNRYLGVVTTLQALGVAGLNLALGPDATNLTIATMMNNCPKMVLTRLALFSAQLVQELKQQNFDFPCCFESDYEELNLERTLLGVVLDNPKSEELAQPQPMSLFMPRPLTLPPFPAGISGNE